MRRPLVAAGAVLALCIAGVVVARSGAAATGGPSVSVVDVGGHPVTVVVTPGRPGRNLVQAVSPHGMPVEGGGIRTLPAGPSVLRVAVGPRSAEVRVDPGGRRSTAAVDEECASRLLGLRLAGRRPEPCRPPRARDAAAIAAALVRHLAGAQVQRIAVVGDATPRGAAAVGGAVAEGHRTGVDVRVGGAPPGPEEALLVLGSWEQARAAVATARPGRGTLLAPWLLEPGALGATGAQVTVASTIPPNGAVARRYLAALAEQAPGIPPSATGLAAFAGRSPRGPLQLWTPAALAFLPRLFSTGHDHAHEATWSPQGALALVRSALPYELDRGGAPAQDVGERGAPDAR